MNTSEYELMTRVIVPYLEKNWSSIDRVPTIERGNGRLTKEKLFIKYMEKLGSGKVDEALVLESIIERYDSICQAYEDAYIPEEEGLLGISEEDVSVYLQQLSTIPRQEGEPSECSDQKPKPRHWLPS